MCTQVWSKPTPNPSHVSWEPLRVLPVVFDSCAQEVSKEGTSPNSIPLCPRSIVVPSAVRHPLRVSMWTPIAPRDESDKVPWITHSAAIGSYFLVFSIELVNPAPSSDIAVPSPCVSVKAFVLVMSVVSSSARHILRIETSLAGSYVDRHGASCSRFEGVQVLQNSS